MSAEASDEAPRKVLLANHEATGRSLIREALRADGFEVIEAQNGRQVVSAFATHQPDLVLMDLDMPQMNGVEACIKLRARHEGEGVPILLLSHLSDKETIQEAYAAGATDIMIKPVNIVLVSYRVRYLIDSTRAMMQLTNRQSSTNILKALPDVVFLVRRDGVILDDIHARAQSPMLGSEDNRSAKSLDSLWPANIAQAARRHVKRVLSSREGSTYEFCIDQSDEPCHYEARFNVHARDRVLVIVRDISERKRVEAQMKELAVCDQVTGLPNRHTFLETFHRGLDEAALRERRLSLILVDCSDVRRVNVNLGRRVGDTILKVTAARLSEYLEQTYGWTTADEPESGVHLARWAGDEFILLLPGQRTRQVRDVAMALQEALMQPVVFSDYELIVQPTIGIAHYPNDGADIESLLRHAAMVRRKIEMSDASMRSRTLERLDLASELGAALSQNQFQLHFQPRVELNTGKVVGIEALLRWNRPIGGIQSADAFISIAEETGLIVPIGEWVFQEVCNQVRRWHAKGLPPIRIAVNVSRRQFSHHGFAQDLIKVLNATPVDPWLLELELTESTLIRDPGEAISALKSIKELGVALTVDDFGTDYSSISCLKQFPVDSVKIDASCVRNTPEDEGHRAICAAIISMAHEFKTDVIAEGVENETQLEFLREQGCDQVQGFLFCEPLSADALTEFLTAQRDQRPGENVVDYQANRRLRSG